MPSPASSADPTPSTGTDLATRWRVYAGWAVLAAILLPGARVMMGANPSHAANSSDADTPARITWPVSPQYPLQLLGDGIYARGSVVVALDLDETGKIQRAFVTFASHPAFVPATMEAVMEMKFAPALRAGRPVPSAFRVTAPFEVRRLGLDAAAVPATIPEKPKNLPAQFDYDAAPELLSFCDPAYPLDLLLGGVAGDAEVRFVIDPSGRVSEAEASAATRPEFGAALVAAIESWRFSPARRAGKAITTALVQRHKFWAAAFHLSGAEQRALRQLKKGGNDLVNRDARGEPLRPVYRVPPQYPRGLEQRRVSGNAIIEFVIGRNGQAMLPRIVSATEPEFGHAAATAVQQWFFEPPQANGKPVDVRMVMAFDFKPQPVGN